MAWSVFFFFSFCCQKHESWLSLWQNLLPKVPQRMMRKLSYSRPQVKSSVVARSAGTVTCFKACWALIKNEITLTVLLPDCGFRSFSFLIVKLGKSLCLHPVAVAFLTIWNAEITSCVRCMDIFNILGWLSLSCPAVSVTLASLCFGVYWVMTQIQISGLHFR